MKSFALQCLALSVLCAIPKESEAMAIVGYSPNTKARCAPPSALQEKKLFSAINADSRRLYSSLDCEGKNRAMRYAQQKCMGQECQAPQCDGAGKCEFKDKNEAVQQAAKDAANAKAGMAQKYQENDMTAPSQEEMLQDQQQSDGQMQQSQQDAQSWDY